MKKFVFGLLFLGLTSLGYAQELDNEAKEVVLEGVTVTPVNIDYLKKVQGNATPEIVKALENKAARFNIKESPMFDNGIGPYKVYFSNSKGRIVATYNNEGKILSSKEKFGDVVIPVPVRNTVYQAFPDWKINSNTYMVYYNGERGTKKTYHFQIGKDGLKEKLKLVFEGRK